jgi:hypothetical protein
MEALVGTLTERVEALMQVRRLSANEWGSPHLSTTPRSLALENLAAQVANLENAVREIALEVQELSTARTSP